MQIQASDLEFLKKLSANNNRDWFNGHKDQYLIAHEHLIQFADAVLAEMQKVDNIETISGKKSLHRIYRDVRFSKNKDPYKNNWSGSLKRATDLLRGGYYFHIEADTAFVGGGFWGPNSADLKRIRTDIHANPEDLRAILADKSFVDTFSQLEGEQVKTAPKGYKKDDPAIDLLRYKQYIIAKRFTMKEVLDPSFYLQVADVFQKMRPFFDYMSEVLTTDENGVPLFE